MERTIISCLASRLPYQLLSSMYVLSNKIADIVTKPVVLGLVERPEDWVFSSYQANTNDEIETE